MVEDRLKRRSPLVLGVEHLLDVEGAMPAVDEELQLGRIGQNEVLPGHRELEPGLSRDSRQQLLVSPVAVLTDLGRRPGNDLGRSLLQVRRR